MVKLGSIAALALLSMAGQAVAEKTVKVMPFGASIVTRCWRNNLQAKLKSAGITNYDMVGSQKGAADCVTQFPGTDNDHEGHPGSQATTYAAKGNLTTWLNEQPQVDVVLMFLGHNDIIIGHQPFDDILKAYDTLIAQMRKKNSKMQIVWSNLTPVDPAKWDTTDSPNTSKDIATLSSKIKDYAPKKSTPDSPVYFVDNFEGYDAAKDTEDGEHPNKGGNEKIASKFLSATKAAIEAATKVGVNSNKMRNADVGTDFVNVIQDFLEDQKEP